jgi:2-C-methyl-D-erythritol 4-phosphate cytidylyltransferase
LGKSIFSICNDKYPVSLEAGFQSSYFIDPYNDTMTHELMPRCFALIPCGGTGTRAGEGLPKQYRPLAGKAMVAHALLTLSQVVRIEKKLMVISPSDTLFQLRVALPDTTFSIAPCAGNTRSDTVFHGLNALLELGAGRKDWVLVHDAARCLTTPAQINALIDACLPDAVGGLLALKLPDTLKRENAGRSQETVDRADKWLAQTPQMFRLGMLLDALQAAKEAGVEITDEASAMERLGHKPLLVAGSAQNFKITYPEDFALAEAILLSRKNST